MLKEIEPFKIKSGGHMKYMTQNMLKQIINGGNLEDTKQAFEERWNKGTNHSKLLPTFYKRLIEEVDERADDWNS